MMSNLNNHHQNIAANHQASVFADRCNKVRHGWTLGWLAREYQEVWSVVFHVFFDVHELERVFKRSSVDVRFTCRAPVDVRFGLFDVQVDSQDA